MYFWRRFIAMHCDLILLQARGNCVYIGALSSYVSQLFFLSHGITMLMNREKPHWSSMGFALFTLTSIVLMAPYKWDRKWMRMKSLVGITIFGSVLVIYALCALGL